ncbi:MAG: hypothetical protein M3Y25_09345, partial [Thermoproteota archaeon]|nr:hypothetical protein [Thermoproteota archaeon]
FMATFIIVLAAFSFIVLTLPLFYANALPPAPGWGTSKNCVNDTRDTVTTTCCWRERVPGQILGQRYCQTCTYSADGSTTDCGPKVKQMGVSDDINPMAPPTEGVSDDPQVGDNANPGSQPTEGVEDEVPNNDNDDADTSTTNTIPRKDGGNLDTSNINESDIVP